jgi:hypothetical protein
MRQLRQLLWVGLCLAAGPSVAQTLVLDINGLPADVVARTQCDVLMRVHWAVTSTTAKCQDLKIWVTSNSCDEDGPDTTKDEKMIGTVSDLTAGSGDLYFKVNTLPAFTNDNAAGACGLSIERTYNFCGTFKVRDTLGNCPNNDVSPTTSSTTPTLKYDALAPDAPVIEEIVALDGRLSVVLSTNASDADVYQVFVRPVGETIFRSVGKTSTASASASVSDLTNGTTYEIQATVLDEAGNESPPSAVMTGTPVKTDGFFERYKGAQGSERGGCSSAGGPWWALLSLSWAGVRFSRRRR